MHELNADWILFDASLHISGAAKPVTQSWIWKNNVQEYNQNIVQKSPTKMLLEEYNHYHHICSQRQEITYYWNEILKII